MNEAEVFTKISELAQKQGISVEEYVEGLENARGDGEAAKEIKKFRETFPDVKAEDIPDSVWEEVAGGVSLTHAYALYEAKKNRDEFEIRAINEKNASRGAFVSDDGATEEGFTKEQVEKMSGKDVKKNYKNIVKAMRKWRFN